jgi:actin-related protein 9
MLIFLIDCVGLSTTLQTRLEPYMLGNPEQAQHNDVQPRYVRTVKVPDYFAEFRERGDGLAAFLGSSIVAKVRNADFAIVCTP